jgi:hypothetical protein
LIEIKNHIEWDLMRPLASSTPSAPAPAVPDAAHAKRDGDRRQAKLAGRCDHRRQQATGFPTKEANYRYQRLPRVRQDQRCHRPAHFKSIDKNVNDSDRIVVVNPVLQAFGKQRALPSIGPSMRVPSDPSANRQESYLVTAPRMRAYVAIEGVAFTPYGPGMKPQPNSSTQEVLAGLVERITYHNAENGFCVIKSQGARAS